MQRISFVILALSLCLTACGGGIDRDKADKNLEKACLVSIQTLYGAQDTLELKGSAFGSEKSHDGLDLRRVNLNATYVQNGGTVQLKDYTCWFEESTGLTGYLAKFHHIEKDGETIGNDKGTMRGDYNDLIKIQNAVESVLIP